MAKLYLPVERSKQWALSSAPDSFVYVTDCGWDQSFDGLELCSSEESPGLIKLQCGMSTMAIETQLSLTKSQNRRSHCLGIVKATEMYAQGGYTYQELRRKYNPNTLDHLHAVGVRIGHGLRKAARAVKHLGPKPRRRLPPRQSSNDGQKPAANTVVSERAARPRQALPYPLESWLCVVSPYVRVRESWLPPPRAAGVPFGVVEASGRPVMVELPSPVIDPTRLIEAPPPAAVEGSAEVPALDSTSSPIQMIPPSLEVGNASVRSDTLTPNVPTGHHTVLMPSGALPRAPQRLSTPDGASSVQVCVQPPTPVLTSASDRRDHIGPPAIGRRPTPPARAAGPARTRIPTVLMPGGGDLRVRARQSPPRAELSAQRRSQPNPPRLGPIVGIPEREQEPAQLTHWPSVEDELDHVLERAQDFDPRLTGPEASSSGRTVQPAYRTQRIPVSTQTLQLIEDQYPHIFEEPDDGSVSGSSRSSLEPDTQLVRIRRGSQPARVALAVPPARYLRAAAAAYRQHELNRQDLELGTEMVLVDRDAVLEHPSQWLPSRRTSSNSSNPEDLAEVAESLWAVDENDV